MAVAELNKDMISLKKNSVKVMTPTTPSAKELSVLSRRFVLFPMVTG